MRADDWYNGYVVLDVSDSYLVNAFVSDQLYDFPHRYLMVQDLLVLDNPGVVYVYFELRKQVKDERIE